jgi:NH3-dependent NAD+ synthetase
MAQAGGRRAVALMSGGLDSALAVALCRSLGVEVTGLHYSNIFHPGKRGANTAAQRSAAALGVELLLRDSTAMLMAAVRNPLYGYGRNLNPCLDCRTFMMREAKALLPEIGASFIVTGEVLGQRPMSQRGQAMQRIDREAGVEGLVLRPLSAAIMPETVAEREGWIDRTKLPGIRGRSRRTQYELAGSLGVTVYSAPAGGCLLTDPGFCARMRDLLDNVPAFDENDVELLKFGRHFRLSPSVRAVVGRDQADNDEVEALTRPGDVLLEVAAGHSPCTLLRGAASAETLRTAAALTVRYSKSRGAARVEVSSWRPRDGQPRQAASPLTVDPIGEMEADALALGRPGE